MRLRTTGAYPEGFRAFTKAWDGVFIEIYDEIKGQVIGDMRLEIVDDTSKAVKVFIAPAALSVEKYL